VNEKLLTIIVPTYNRATQLALLLRTLREQLRGLEDTIQVVICDNCSTDQTAAVVQSFQANYPNASTVRHAHNCGPDENFCIGIELAASEYFWIMGDDDLPRTGAIPQILQILHSHAPDMLHMNSLWTPHVTSPDLCEPLGSIQAQKMDRLKFARHVNVWTTFISGIIVRRALMPSAELRRYSGTNLVQLAWTLGAIELGKTFIHIPHNCVLATSGNTGGYGILKVFGVNYAQIVKSQFKAEPAMVDALLTPAVRVFLPQLIWDARFRNIGNFLPEKVWSALRKELGDRWIFWSLLTPLIVLPKPLANVFYLGHRVVRRVAREWQRISTRGT
jgi:abequosyltransferase